MAKEIVWTKRANRNFNNIISYLENEWGERVTRNFVNKTYELIGLLSEHPELGSIENKEKGIMGLPITKHNRLFYRITRNQIIILNIFDTRQNPKKRSV